MKHDNDSPPSQVIVNLGGIRLNSEIARCEFVGRPGNRTATGPYRVCKDGRSISGRRKHWPGTKSSESRIM